MGTDLRIVQRIVKIVKDHGGTVVATGCDLELLSKLRDKGALGQADVKRQRSAKHRIDYSGFADIDNAIRWGETVGKLGVIRMDDARMIYTLPLEALANTDEELPAATVFDSALFAPISSYEKSTCDPSLLKYLSNAQYHRWINSE